MQSPGLPHIDLEEMVGREMQCKVLEAIEENDRLVLSNRKSSFSQKKLTYSVRLCNLPYSPASVSSQSMRLLGRDQAPLGYACLARVICNCSDLPQLSHN